MSSLTIGIIGLVLMLLLMFLKMPLALTFLVSGVGGIMILLGPEAGLNYMSTLPFTKAASYTYAVLPLFMLLGDLAVKGDLTLDAYSAIRKWFYRVPGGLAVTSTITSAVFGAICGSMQATAMVMSKMAWPEMKRYGYNGKMALGSICAAAPIAILIPPSIPMVQYGILTDTSIGALFMAGIMPGVLLTAGICLMIIVMCLVKPSYAPKTEKTSLKEKMIALRDAWPILLLVVAMMYCIWGGVCTVNEAAAMGVIFCIIIVLAKRRMNLKDVMHCCAKSVIGGASIIFLLVGVHFFGMFMSLSGVPQALATWVAGLNVGPYAVVWMIIIMYLILGCFIDTPPIIMLTVPLFAPVIAELGFDLIWFGVITSICGALGGVTPPVGINLFVMHAAIPDEPMSTITRGVWPFLAISIVVLALCVYIEPLSLWIPSMMG